MAQQLTKDYVGESLKDRRYEISYMDGFRFGFGMFIAFILGWLIVGGLGVLVALILRFKFHA